MDRDVNTGLGGESNEIVELPDNTQQELTLEQKALASMQRALQIQLIKDSTG